MRTDVVIEIVVLIEKSTGKNRVIYLSECAPADRALDLYVSESSRRIALYHQHAYDDDVLKARRNQNNMVYPGTTDEKMIFVGHVMNASRHDPATHLEVSRAPLHLKNIPIDEL